MTVKTKVDTISYTGNAVAFFSEDTRKMIRFIPVKEKDSTKFKQLDIFKSIKDQPIYCIYIGGYLNRLLHCKEKQILKKEICKYGYASYYVKIWISYRNYLAGPERPGIPDSCRCKLLSETHDSAKIQEFDILHIP